MSSAKTIQKLIDDGKIETALEQINAHLKDKATADLHCLRIKVLSRLERRDETLIVQTSLAWLAAHAPEQAAEMRTLLHDIIQQRLAQIIIPDTVTDETPGPDVERLIDPLLPLAHNFPLIHLSYGLALLHKGQTLQHEPKTPLDILEEILAGANAEKNPGAPVKRTPREEKQHTIYHQARQHLEQALHHFAADDPHCGGTLEALGQVCEALDDPIGAWQAYQRLQAYGQEHSEKVTQLARMIKDMAQTQALASIDRFLREGQLDKAAAVLAACALHDSPEFRIRAADLAFLRGDYQQAALLYRHILE